MTVMQWFPMLGAAISLLDTIFKDVTESKSSDTVRADDDELFSPVLAGNRYFIEGQVSCFAEATGDYKYNLQMTTGTLNLACGFQSYNANPSAPGATLDTPLRTVWTEGMLANTFFNVLQVSVATVANERLIIDWQQALDVATDGTYALSWAQNTSDVPPTITYRNSWMIARELDGVLVDGVLKSATQTKISTNTFADDTELFFSAAANRIYRVRVLLNVWSNVNPDFKCRLTYSGTTLEFGGKCEANTVAGATSSLPTASSGGPYTQEDFAAGTAFTMNGDATTSFRGGVLFDCVIKTGTSGTFAMQWAPNTNTASSAQVIEGSSLVWEDITDAAALGIKFAHKTSDEVRSSSATLTNDSVLSVNVTAGEYILEGYAAYYSPVTPGFKFALAFSGTCEAFGRCEYLQTMRATGGLAGGSPESLWLFYDESVFGTSFTVTGSATSTHRGYCYFRIAMRVTSAGSISFQWAQNTSDGANTTVYGGAYLMARRVSAS